MLVNTDPPKHTSERKLVSQAFSPRRVKRLGDWLDCLVPELLEQLDGRHRLGFEDGDCIAAGLDIWKYDQRRGFVRVVDHGVIGDRADKTKSALGTHQQMAEDIQRFIEIH